MSGQPPARTGRTGRTGRTLRTRLMTVGVLGVAGALLLGGLLIYVALTRSLAAGVTEQVQVTARGNAALLDSGQLPDPIPQAGAQIVQVLDTDNRVVSGSLNADRIVSLVSPSERELMGQGGGVITVPGSRAALPGSLRVAGVTAGSGGHLLVVVALPTGESDTTAGAVGRLMLVAFPLLLLVMALVAWRVIGAALRPVEDLRAGAERIGADPAAPERLPVSGGADEIAALATTLNSMLDRLAAAQRQQRDFVADAAHELRNPLATMRMHLDVADHLGQGGGLPAELGPELARLTALVEDLLTLARAGDARPARPQRVQLPGFLTEIAGRYAAARVPVVLAPPGDAGQDGALTAYLCREDLGRAVTNLVDNAVRHAATGVQLAARVDSGRALLSVTDDGHGIPTVDRQRVFERFARLDEARARDEGGSGLGLPIARELLRRNGGDVRLEDGPDGTGLSAVVLLPTSAGGAASGGRSGTSS